MTAQRTAYRYVLPAPDDESHAEREAIEAALWRAGATGLWERDTPGGTEIVAYFTARSGDVPTGGRWEVEEERDWLAEWKAGLEPFAVGTLTIAPTWSGLAPDRRTIVLDPAMAFGTGQHATTRLCLLALEDLDVTGRRVLDVGTGTGILAIAAARRGAAAVVGVDIDRDAIDAARENAARNDAEVDLRHGGLDAAADRAPYDIVLANLVTGTILDLAGDLVAAVAPGGTLVASGVATDRTDAVIRALADAGAPTVDVAADGEWSRLVATIPLRDAHFPADVDPPRDHPESAP